MTAARSFVGAHHHFNILKADIDHYLEQKPYQVVVDRPADRTYVVRVDNAPDIPAEEWGLVVGDCVHCIRAALDYVAWRLAGSVAGDRQTQFPIFDTRAGWTANHERRVGRMKPEAQAILEKGQPFNAPDPNRAGLTAIRILDDADKHKLITVVAAMPTHFSAVWAVAGRPATPIRMEINHRAVLSGNTVIATFEFADTPSEMKIQTYLSPDIAFGSGLFNIKQNVAVVGSLSAMLSEATAIVDLFENRVELFQSGPLS